MSSLSLENVSTQENCHSCWQLCLVPYQSMSYCLKVGVLCCDRGRPHVPDADMCQNRWRFASPNPHGHSVALTLTSTLAIKPESILLHDRSRSRNSFLTGQKLYRYEVSLEFLRICACSAQLPFYLAPCLPDIGIYIHRPLTTRTLAHSIATYPKSSIPCICCHDGSRNGHGQNIATEFACAANNQFDLSTLVG